MNRVRFFGFLIGLSLALAVKADVAEPRSDILVADFEGEDYGDWKAEGQAFGPGPARGTLKGQMAVSGFRGKGLANSFFGGDRSVGALTSPPFKVERKHIAFLVGGGGYAGETCVNLLVDGKAVRTAVGPNTKPGGSERLDWHTWDVADLAGREAVIQVVDRRTGGWGHVNVDHIIQTDQPPQPQAAPQEAPEPLTDEPLYHETCRPQFHFSPAKNWTNDPNGLVWYRGEYHLFFQHNPTGIKWGNMTWGHAVSPDLLHWAQLEHAILPDEHGTIFSGSAVVDHGNTAGFQAGDEKAIVAVFTYAGKPFTQGIAWSIDRGRTFTKFPRPVLENLGPSNRDPKVFCHKPTGKWVMVLYLGQRGKFALFGSKDLKQWTKLSDVEFPGGHECPELFELPVDGRAAETRWVLWEGAGRHIIGLFDGEKFTPQSDVLPSEWGANCYAGQTWNDEPDGRRIFIGWMRGGKYPRMPFNQQMSFPRELALRTTGEGLRLFALPVREIETIRGRKHSWADVSLQPGDNPLSGRQGDLWDIEAEIDPGQAGRIELNIRGTAVTYDVKERKLACLGKSAAVPPAEGRFRLRVLVDRTSIEVFANGGRVVMSFCFLPDPKDTSLGLAAAGGTATVRSLAIYELKSTWPATASDPALPQKGQP